MGTRTAFAFQRLHYGPYRLSGGIYAGCRHFGEGEEAVSFCRRKRGIWIVEVALQRTGRRIDPSIYRMENSYTTTTVGRTCQGIKDRVCRRMEEAGITDNRVTKTISFDNRIFRAVALLTIDQSFEFTSRPSNDSLRSSDIKKRAIHFELSTPRSGKKKKKGKKKSRDEYLE